MKITAVGLMSKIITEKNLTVSDARKILRDIEIAARETKVAVLTKLAENPKFDRTWTDEKGKLLFPVICEQLSKSYGELTNYDAAATWEKKAKEFAVQQEKGRLPGHLH